MIPINMSLLKLEMIPECRFYKHIQRTFCCGWPDVWV